MDGLAAPLTWGMSANRTKTLAKKHLDWHGIYTEKEQCNYLAIGDIVLRNFHGDCGALCLDGANKLNEKELKFIDEFCSEGGFSKIFATIVARSDIAEKQAKLFENLGWSVISRGHSNRNPTKVDIVLFKHINCNYRGY